MFGGDFDEIPSEDEGNDTEEEGSTDTATAKTGLQVIWFRDGLVRGADGNPRHRRSDRSTPGLSPTK